MFRNATDAEMELDSECEDVTRLLNRHHDAEFIVSALNDGTVYFQASDVIPGDTGRSVRQNLIELLSAWLDALKAGAA